MILITGGAGMMGRRLCSRLKEDGRNVRILALPGDPAAAELSNKGIQVHYGNIADKESLKGLCDEVDTVFHLAAVILSPLKPERFWKVNYEGTRNLIEFCEKTSVRHFIYISSVSVTYPNSNEYARSKRAAENLVRESTVPHFTIVRPTLVYDNGGGIEFMHFVNYLKRFPVVPFIGRGRALKSPVHADDIIEGLVRIYGNTGAFNKTYNFSGGDEISIRSMAELILKHSGEKKLIFPVPVFLCRLLTIPARLIAVLTGKPPLLTWQTISGITQDANADHHNAAEDLGYSPRTFLRGLSEVKLL